MLAGSDPAGKAKAKAKAKCKAKAKANPGGVGEVTAKTPEDLKAELGILAYIFVVKVKSTPNQMTSEVDFSKGN